MQALARFERLQNRNRRAAERRQLKLVATLSETGDDAVIHDLSATGILIETTADLATFEQLQLDLPEAGQTVATVMWNSGQYYGCEFHRPIPQAAISAAQLRSPFEQPVASTLSEEADESEEAAVADDDRYSLSVRLRVILGTSIILWAAILLAFAIL